MKVIDDLEFFFVGAFGFIFARSGGSREFRGSGRSCSSRGGAPEAPEALEMGLWGLGCSRARIGPFEPPAAQALRSDHWGSGNLGAQVFRPDPLSLQPLKCSDRTLSAPIRPFLNLNLQVAWHQLSDRKVGSASIGGIRASER